MSAEQNTAEWTEVKWVGQRVEQAVTNAAETDGRASKNKICSQGQPSLLFTFQSALCSLQFINEISK